jgi:hypothetical protein
MLLLMGRLLQHLASHLDRVHQDQVAHQRDRDAEFNWIVYKKNGTLGQMLKQVLGQNETSSICSHDTDLLKESNSLNGRVFKFDITVLIPVYEINSALSLLSSLHLRSNSRMYSTHRDLPHVSLTSPSRILYIASTIPE